MITKELLSEVLGCAISKSVDVHGITRVIGIDDEPDGTFLTFGYQSYESSHKRYINIYELAHKCKEWAVQRGYGISISYSIHATTKELLFIQCELHNKPYETAYFDMERNSEPEAIFKACQWILDNAN